MERELESRIERLAHMLADLQAREERLAVEGEALTGSMADWKQRIEDRSGEVAKLYVDRDARREELHGAQDVIEAKRAEVEQIQDQLREVEKRRRGRGEALLEVETELTRMELTTQNLEDRIEEKFQTTVEKGFASLDPESIPDELVREDDIVQIAANEAVFENMRRGGLTAVNYVGGYLESYDDGSKMSDRELRDAIVLQEL